MATRIAIKLLQPKRILRFSESRQRRSWASSSFIDTLIFSVSLARDKSVRSLGFLSAEPCNLNLQEICFGLWGFDYDNEV